MRTVFDICSGGGGEALGLELAGFTAIGAVENDKAACATLRLNRSSLRVIEGDIRATQGADFRGVDLLAGEFLARHSPSPGSNRERRMSAICFQRRYA